MTRDEFENLLTKYEKDVYSICIRLTDSKNEAEDLFQDTWLAAMEQMASIDLKKNPKSYLLGKAVLLWKAKKRKLARRLRIAPQADMEGQTEDIFFAGTQLSPEQIAERNDLFGALRREVSLLKEKYRIVVEFYYAMDLPAREIAGILKIPQGTVESRLCKARKILKSRMEELGYEIG